jgi:hypothetical protein
LYQFFLEYWKFVTKYWKAESNPEWWNCFIADLAYYVTKYEDNDFCVNLLMELYHRNREGGEPPEVENNLVAFYSDWWQYVNRYYAADDSSQEWWENFLRDTGYMGNKYEESQYFMEVIYTFVCCKTA